MTVILLTLPGLELSSELAEYILAKGIERWTSPNPHGEGTAMIDDGYKVSLFAPRGHPSHNMALVGDRDETEARVEARNFIVAFLDKLTRRVVE